LLKSDHTRFNDGAQNHLHEIRLANAAAGVPTDEVADEIVHQHPEVAAELRHQHPKRLDQDRP
jgi:hypothetical protein